MKKTYINPNTAVYNVEFQKNMLQAVSATSTTGITTGGKTSDTGFTGVEAKEDSGWDLFD